MGNVLEITGLNKSYKDFSLTDVSFTLPEDCITGFIGINGAGKTTTIRTILGLTQKASGTIKVFGKDIASNEQELKDRIGVVLDGGCFYDELTMAEMKSVVAPAYSKWNEKDYKEYLDRFSLNPKQKIATLSKGMRMLMLSLFVREVPGNIRWLSELWYLIPSNLINLNGAFRYSLLSVGNLQIASYQYAFPIYALLSAAFVLAGRWVYGKYQIKAR